MVLTEPIENEPLEQETSEAKEQTSQKNKKRSTKKLLRGELEEKEKKEEKQEASLVEVTEEDMQEVLFADTEIDTKTESSSDDSIIADIGISFNEEGEPDALSELTDSEDLLEEEEEIDLAHLSKSIEKDNSHLQYETRIKSMKTESLKPSDELQDLLDPLKKDPLKGVKVEKQDSKEPKVKPPSFSDIKGATTKSGPQSTAKTATKVRGIRPQGPKAQRIKPKGTITNSRTEQRKAAQQEKNSKLNPQRFKPSFSSVSENPLLSYFILPTIGLLCLLAILAVLIVSNPISTSNTLKTVANNVPSIAPPGVFIETIEFDKTELDNGEYLIVVDGTVSNIREDASFTDVVVEAQAYDRTGSLITSERSILGQGLNVLGKTGITAKSRHYLKLYQEKKEGMPWILPAQGKRTFTIGLFNPDAARAAYFSARIFSVSYTNTIVSQKSFPDEDLNAEQSDQKEKDNPKRAESERSKKKRKAPPLKRFRTKARMQQ